MLCDHKEVFYGGSAGGGKTVGLLMCALQYVDMPEYSALLVRRTYPQLSQPNGLIETSKTWLQGTDARWNAEQKRWTFPSGATLSFGHLENEDDKYEYQGSEYHCIGIDELTHLTKTQYEYLFSRLRRRIGSPIPIRMRATSNPGGPGHDWVKQKFLVEKKPDRLFIPAGLVDNPHLDREEYVKSLGELDPVTQAQLLHGDWNIRSQGNFFHREWLELKDGAPKQDRVVRFWDRASTDAEEGEDPDYTVGLKLGIREKDCYILDIRRVRANSGQVEDLMHQTAVLDGIECQVYQEQEGGSSGKALTEHMVSVLRGFHFKGIPSTGSKVTRAQPVSAAAYNQRLKIVNGPWVKDFFDELEMFPDGPHDDQVDALSGAFNALHTSDTARLRAIAVRKVRY